MKLIASGVTCSAARVRSPSFSRSSSSTTTTMRPARISSRAPGTSINGASCVRDGVIGWSYCRPIPWQTAKQFGNQTGRIETALKAKAPHKAALLDRNRDGAYNVDSISKPHASRRASGMYLEFLLRRAHSLRRVDRMYWSGVSLNSFTICSKEVTVGATGLMGSGLPQFGFPRRFAIDWVSLNEIQFDLLSSAAGRGNQYAVQ